MIAGGLEIAAGAHEPAIRARLEQMTREDVAARLARHDVALWGDDPTHQKVAANRLGWLDAPAVMRARVTELEAFAAEIAADGFRHALLLGMGGSSLAPETLMQTFGARTGRLELAVLDNTSPRAVRATLEAHDPQHTLVIVSSKSGGTLEVVSFEKAVFDWMTRARGAGAGRAFIAITDPGTTLGDLARARGYRRTFENAPDIGGRYSALSYFGLVPAALIGADLAALLDRAVAELDTDRLETAAANNAGLALGAALGELALAGRDKLTLVLGESLEALGPWVEQLVAESTGKQGRGLLPVDDEPLADPERYGADRVFVVVYEGVLPPPHARRLDALQAAGHPVLRWKRDALSDLGAEFARWEVATATAGHVIGVDPFDEPNVSEAKQATQQVLTDFLARGHFEEPAPLASFGGLSVYAPAAFAATLEADRRLGDDPCDWVCALVDQLAPHDYLAMLAWFARTPRRHELLQSIRLAARDRRAVATTLGYGPRYLHSTGQLHKGGPASGVFLQLSAEKDEWPIPGERYGFKAVHRAQCLGDYLTLDRRGRRVLRVHMSGGVEHSLETLLDALRS